MKFGQVENPEDVDFTLPQDANRNKFILSKGTKKLSVYIGCAKWNRKELKGFYPRGTKDELEYYSQQFNSIELNATFYNVPSQAQIEKWRDKTPKNFRFCPKITNSISHYKRLINAERATEEYCHKISAFEEKLGPVFLQLHDNFAPKNFDRLQDYIKKFTPDIPLAVEVRNKEWFDSDDVSDELFEMLELHGKTNIIVDTAGRRDMLHMRLTNRTAFVRFVGANHDADYARLDEWVDRVVRWKEQGLEELYFFVHQNVEVESPLLASYFIQHLNTKIGYNIHVPQLQNNKI